MILYSILFVILIGIIIYERRKVRTPLGIRKRISYPFNITRQLDNRKIRFKPKLVPDDIDLILIGSGISNLTLGGLLSRLGWKILILEQHDIAGGSTHTFEDKGFLFDTGLHYVGYNERTFNILDIITGENNKIEWKQMGKDAIVSDGTFDIFRIGDQEYRIGDDENDLINYLSDRFPNEKDGITRYFQFVKYFAKKDKYFALKVLKPVWLANFLDPYVNREFYSYSQRSTYDVVGDYIQDPKLKDVICTLSIDGGPRSEIQSFFIHASIVNHFLKGGYYPIGGPGVIAQKMIPTIEDSGGKVLVKSRVNQIQIEKGRVIGVKLSYGYNFRKTCEIMSKYGVVSGIGLYNTYRKLLPIPYNLGMNEVLNNVSHKLTYNLLYVGLDRSAAELEIGSINIWAWDIKNEGKSFNDCIKEFEADPWNVTPPMFIASNSAKDPDWDKTRSGKCALIVGSWGTTDQYFGLDITGISKKRDIAYNEAKEKFRSKLENYLYKIYPKTRGHVIYKALATPETFKYYLNAPFGEVYGIDSDINRWTRYPKLRPETEVPGLYLTGQDLTSLGFSGSLMSGVITTMAILNYGELKNVILGRDFFKEIST